VEGPSAAEKKRAAKAALLGVVLGLVLVLLSRRRADRG